MIDKGEVCPICENRYKDEDDKVVYHVTYKPEVVTFSCKGCNYAEYLIRHPEIQSSYFMEGRKKIVKEWTLRIKPLISRISSLHLVVDIKVSDLNRAVGFYTKTLGLLCRRQEKDWAAIAVGDAELHLYLNGGVTGHIEFYVEDIDAEVAHLKKSGVTFISGTAKPNAINVDANNITTFPWGRTAFFRDCEGNELALVKDSTGK